MKIKRTLLLFILFFPFLCAAAGGEIRNSILKVKMDIVGNISLWTTGGDPSQSYDDNKSLLNNRSFGSTFVVVSVNGKSARMGGSSGKNRILGSMRNGMLISSWEFRGVLFTQRVSFHKSHYSGKNSLARVHIQVENKSGKEAVIGLRMVVDPMLGPSDSRPLLVPGKGAVVSGTLLKSEDQIPSIIYGCHKPVNTSGDFVLNLYGPGLVKPDRVYIATPAYFSEDSVFDPGSRGNPGKSISGKSAVGLVWQPKKFAAGAKDGVAVGLGTAIHKRIPGQPVNVMMTAPIRTSREDFWVGVVIENEDKYWDISSLAVSLRYSGSKARLIKGSTRYTFSSLPRRGMVFAYWKFRITGSGKLTPVVDLTGRYRSQSIRKSYQTTSVLTK